MDVLLELFRDYVIIGRMPEVVDIYVRNKNFSGTLEIQKQLLKDYEEDITKYAPKLYKIYFKDTGLLIASLDEEAQEDLRANKNSGTYKGAIYENIVVKQGYRLFYYHSERPVLGMDFLSGMPSLWFRWK